MGPRTLELPADAMIKLTAQEEPPRETARRRLAENQRTSSSRGSSTCAAFPGSMAPHPLPAGGVLVRCPAPSRRAGRTADIDAAIHLNLNGSISLTHPATARHRAAPASGLTSLWQSGAKRPDKKS